MKTKIKELIQNGFTHREIQKKLEVGLATISKIRNASNNNVLVVGDLHAPFIREGYLEFCKQQYKEHNCNIVVFTGDVLDSHFSSYHEANPDGMAAGEELDLAIAQLKEWHEAFPGAKVCIGNHDRIAYRKAFTSGVSSKWIKDYADVLECPTWDFQLGFDIDGVRYEHGEGAKPHIKMLRNRQSYVCGHVHSKLSIEFSVSEHDRLFAMQLGWGGDQSAYSMDYARNFAKGIVSCGVVLKNGTMPIAIPMPLMDKEKLNK